MTIIHLLIGLGGGGAEHFLLDLVRETKQRPGIRVKVISISSIDKIGYKYNEAGIEYSFLGIRNLKTLLLNFPRFLRMLNNDSKCIIHAHMFHACMFACVAKILIPSNKIIFTLHTNHVKQSYRKVLLFMTKALRSADIIFSKDAKQWYHAKNSVVIPNGIDLSRFNLESSVPSVFTCLFVGRLEEPKNPLYLIELVKKLKAEHKFKIVVAGDGNLKESLIKKIKENQLEEYFSLIGFRKDIPYLLACSHCLIMPSLWEGMPISILEAGAAGVPVIATPVGSIPNILNSDNAYLGNLQQFDSLLKEVLSDYEVASMKAKRLQEEIVARYNISVSEQEHLKLYEKILKTKVNTAVPDSTTG